MKPRIHAPRFPLAAKYRDGDCQLSPTAPHRVLGQLVSAVPFCIALDLVVEFLRRTCTETEIDDVARRAKRGRLPAAAPLFQD